uniref:Conserved oligomeric Golgi complex subunit 1 n=1 Tax=Panagrellus redivivus TaxID=6233 RepID=A0A7E4UPL7_PANRE
MDVERLMRDLTIDQLQNIQESLSKQTEEKREELRKMVGRRYRDVLDASKTVKRLTEVAGELAVKMETIRTVTKTATWTPPPKLPVKTETIIRYGLLQKLVPLLNDKTDGLSDVFALVLAENLHRGVSIEAADFASAGVVLASPLKSIGQLLIQHRLSLLDRLQHTLGDDTDWQSVSGLLVAIALLKQYSLEELLEVYLRARKAHIAKTLENCSTLLSVIEEMKKTVECVDDVFGRGAAICSALAVVTEPGWCPDQIMTVVQFQVSDYSKQLRAEIARVNGSYSKSKAQLSEEFVEKQATAWIEALCGSLETRLRSMASFFEKTADIVDFVVAVDDIFGTPWPCVASNSAVYNQLFGSSLLDRFKALTKIEVSALERQLREKAVHASMTNQPSLFQRRGTRFDALIASGVSQELHDAIEGVFEVLSGIIASTSKYVSIGKEADKDSLQTTLAEAALDLTKRLTEEAEREAPEGDVRNFWLTRFRLFLALVQHEPAVLCQCMGRNTEAIIGCNKLLHTAAEKSLCNFMDAFIAETVAQSKISLMPEYVASPVKFLDLAQEVEKHKLAETDATTIEIPTQLSRFYFAFLYSICAKTNTYAVAHLFTRNVTTHVSKVLGQILAKSLIEAATKAATDVPMILAQVLFDAKTLFFMFMDPGLLEAVKIVEEKLDPINRAVLVEPLTKNAKLYVQRTTMLFGQLQVEPITASGQPADLPDSYTSLIDITPFITNIPRLPLIPGMSVIEQQTSPEDAKRKKKAAARQAPKNEGTLPHASSDAVIGSLLGAKQNISSLYDKFSTNWFKN